MIIAIRGVAIALMSAHGHVVEAHTDQHGAALVRRLDQDSKSPGGQSARLRE